MCVVPRYEKGSASEADADVYLLRFNAGWNIDAVLTQFVVKKTDLDRAFAEQQTTALEKDANSKETKLAP